MVQTRVTLHLGVVTKTHHGLQAKQTLTKVKPRDGRRIGPVFVMATLQLCFKSLLKLRDAGDDLLLRHIIIPKLELELEYVALDSLGMERMNKPLVNPRRSTSVASPQGKEIFVEGHGTNLLIPLLLCANRITRKVGESLVIQSGPN